MADRLLTDEEIRKQCNDCTDKDNYCLRHPCHFMQGKLDADYPAQDRKSVKAVIEEIENTETCKLTCLMSCQEVRFSKYCKWWQQFKERNGVK